MSKVVGKFDEERNSRMVEEDKHSIKSWESLKTTVQKLDLAMTALEERKVGAQPAPQQLLRVVVVDSSLGHQWEWVWWRETGTMSVGRPLG